MIEPVSQQGRRVALTDEINIAIRNGFFYRLLLELWQPGAINCYGGRALGVGKEFQWQFAQ